MNTCSCLNLILACIVYWQACEISRVLSECDPLANGIDLSLLEHVSPIEWDNVVLYGQYILDRKLVRQRSVAQKGSSLAYKITRISLVPYIDISVGIVFWVCLRGELLLRRVATPRCSDCYAFAPPLIPAAGLRSEEHLSVAFGLRHPGKVKAR